MFGNLYRDVSTISPNSHPSRTKLPILPEKGYFFDVSPVKLALADGKVYPGLAPAGQAPGRVGEVVFNTGMTGYVESLTDPSYANQILVFTYPLIGNYGVLDRSVWESDRIHAAGVVVSEACVGWSHAGSSTSLMEWLKEQQVPIITGVDTRSLTKHLRAHGTMIGQIAQKPTNLSGAKVATPHISVAEPIVSNPKGRKHVILVDCGAKNNIERSLIRLGARVTRVPHDYDYTNESFDGVVYSNGPGDPTDYPETIKIAKKILATNQPVFGICLGCQIIGLAGGGKTYKLPFGHRGHNQPCLNDTEGRCYITSQNHGYALDELHLGAGWDVTFRNLNDNSVEGIRHQTKPQFAVQFHPEASPGPTDTAWLFETFFKTL